MSYWITVQVINEKALSGKPFSAKDINEETICRGGISRVDICYPTRYYLQDMARDGYFRRDGHFGEDTLYQATDKFLALAKAHPEWIKNGVRFDLKNCSKQKAAAS